MSPSKGVRARCHMLASRSPFVSHTDVRVLTLWFVFVSALTNGPYCYPGMAAQRSRMIVSQSLLILISPVSIPSSSNQQSKPWYRKNAPAGENERARKAYRVLMTVTLRKPDSEEYLRFANEVQDRAKTHYNYEYASQEVSSPLLIGSPPLSQWLTSGLSIGPWSFSQWLARGLF